MHAVLSIWFAMGGDSRCIRATMAIQRQRVCGDAQLHQYPTKTSVFIIIKMKVMKKEIYILLPLVLLLIGCNKTKSSTNTLASNIGDATIDSVIVLGRDPYEFTSIPIGRYAFVEYCISKNVNNRLRLMNKKHDIDDIALLLNNLEMVDSLKQGEFSPADFPYKLLIKGGAILSHER